MRNTIINRVVDEARKKKNIFLITGDAGFGILDGYKKNFPDRFLNFGVAEQNMIGFSAGLALTGYKVFIYNIIPFLLYRCYEQVRNDICYQRLPVTLIGIGSGVTYAPQGITHYAVEDIAIARTLPNLVILSPSDPAEAEKAVDFACKSKYPVYIRIAKSGEPLIHRGKVRDIVKPIVVKEGRGTAVLFHGSIGTEVIKAIDAVKRCPRLISIPMIQPLNFDALLKNLKDIHTLITVEEHFIEGGLGSVVSNWLTREKLPFRLKRLGIKHEFIHEIKDRNGMRSFYGISSDNIRKIVMET
jgi:transketolase